MTLLFLLKEKKGNDVDELPSKYISMISERRRLSYILN